MMPLISTSSTPEIVIELLPQLAQAPSLLSNFSRGISVLPLFLEGIF
jgi:hypothetical protein